MLEQNYRSTQPILDVGNAVLSNMKHKFEKRLVSGTGLTGEKPGFRRFADMYEEAAWVADRVQSLRAQGVPTREMAVLFRTAFASMPLQSELIKKGIRFRLFGGRKFYETAHVRDVISYLRIIANPADELSWHRVLLLLPGIGTRTVERLLELISGRTASPVSSTGHHPFLYRPEALGRPVVVQDARAVHRRSLPDPGRNSSTG